MEVKLTDQASQPVPLKFAEGDAGAIEIILKAGRATPVTALDREATKKVTATHWPTAFPIVQPWGFLLTTTGFVISLGWLIIRAILKRRA